MGRGIVLGCKKCKFRGEYFLGIGMFHNRTRQEVAKEVCSGKYGEEWKELYEKNPGSSIGTIRQLYQCPSCNYLKDDFELSLYIEDRSTRFGNRNNYECEIVYNHKCPRCSTTMQNFAESEKEEILCPECGDRLDIVGSILWD